MYEGFERDLHKAQQRGGQHWLGAFVREVAAETGFDLSDVYRECCTIHERWDREAEMASYHAGESESAGDVEISPTGCMLLLALPTAAALLGAAALLVA